jgi:NADPH-dependent F420 reductase
MRVAIIGIGRFGSPLAQACSTAGHEVVISARTPAHAAKAAAGLNVLAAESNREAVQGADMVILAVPSRAVAAVLDEIGDDLEGTILVDPTNPVAEDDEDILRATGSVADAIMVLAPGARVVKAFNTIFASRLNDPAVDGVRLDGFYAGNDPAAKEVVATLLQRMGFRPIDTGMLIMSRVLELMGFLNIRLNATHGWPWESGWKLLGPTGRE